MEERHEREQYFFDAATVRVLADFVGSFERPCCLCAPMVGRELHRRGRAVRVLDVDERFADLSGFLAWDLYRPRHLDEEFDLVLCDPPFFNVSLSQLFSAVRVLCHFDLTKPVMISYPARRSRAILGTFAPFGLRPTGYRPGYQTVQKCDKNEIEFYANFDADLPRRLAAGE
jgi:Probable N6-adenine methyltransferase